VTIEACDSAGGHFNPCGTPHGDLTYNADARHVGDLGNVVSDNSGKIVTVLTDPVSRLYGAFGIIGRTIVLYALKDDLGLGGNAASRLNGNSGARIACGVIGIA
jgi:Cu-Zn family superoxide dismutase